MMSLLIRMTEKLSMLCIDLNQSQRDFLTSALVVSKVCVASLAQWVMRGSSKRS